MSNKITVTNNYMKMQKDLEEEFTEEFPYIPPNKKSETLPKFSSQFYVPDYTSPKSGYFGSPPKRPGHFRQSISNQFYPNYLKRDPKEYPPIHACEFVPKSTTNHTNKQIKSEHPKTKFIHHTIYNSELREMLSKNPSIKRMNKASYPSISQSTFNLTSSAYPDFTRNTTKNETTDMMNTSYGSGGADGSKIMTQTPSKMDMYSTLTKSIQWKTSHNSMNSTFSSKLKKDPQMGYQKYEKLLQRHAANESKYNDFLLRQDEVAKKNMGRFQTEVNTIPSFQKTMSSTSNLFTYHEEKKQNEKERFYLRVKDIQQKKYEDQWKKFNVSYEKNTPNKVKQSQTEEFNKTMVSNKSNKSMSLTNQRMNTDMSDDRNLLMQSDAVKLFKKKSSLTGSGMFDRTKTIKL